MTRLSNDCLAREQDVPSVNLMHKVEPMHEIYLNYPCNECNKKNSRLDQSINSHQ